MNGNMGSGAQVSTGQNFGAQGAAEPVLAGQSARSAYKANASALPEDTWYELDDLMVGVAQERLNIVADWQAAGLIEMVDIGTTVTSWQETNAFDDADVDMAPESIGSEDASIHQTKYAPVPIIHKDFKFNRREGDQHDVRGTNAPKAVRTVLEKMEEFAVSGWDQKITDADGREARIYGLANHPDRNTHTGSGWSDETVVDQDIRDMIGKAKDDNYYGPYRLYIAGDVDDKLLAPSADFDNMRLRQQIAQMNAISDIVVSDKIPDGEAFLVDLSPEVVDGKMIEGGPVDAAEWENTPFVTKVKSFGGFAPRIKSDMGDDGSRQSGIVHATGL
ncbi:major capsid protein [Halostella sp. PRR32]|uniref:major capsid protein n=1 Tax=Halostella sp. PRR32 TaxID=3098147 RepID=UPI002B1D13E0|nr:major capsid protein [Halostella sp. PRR32]